MKNKLVLICLFLTATLSVYSQTRTVRGRVTSAESGESIVAATISVKGTTIGVITDVDGKLTVDVPQSGGVLVASFVGMQTLEVPITSASTYDFVLESSNVDLDEVVVTALGITREKKTLGYAVQNVDGEKLNQANDPNIVNSLSGKVAGVQVTSGGSAVGASSRIIIRGNASFSGNQPLFVVDGTPIDNSTSNLDGYGGIDWGNAASDIDPNNIESVVVLKGSSASALYGSRATNGVILITTKKASKSDGRIGVDVVSSIVLDQPAYFPNLQNEYGGGWDGSEYKWNKYNEENGTSLSYNEYAKQFAYNYVDGKGGGVNDYWPINWGPRLDAGLRLDQWATGPDSPYNSRPDNVKEWFETGVNIENSVAVSSSSEKASGRLTFTTRSTTGIVDYTDQAQNTIAGSFSLRPSKWISADGSFTYLVKKSDNVPESGYRWADTFGWLQRDYPTQTVKDLFYEKGNEDYIFPLEDNPFYVLRNTNSFTRNRFFGSFNITFNITDWLFANARYGVDYYGEYRSNIEQSGTQWRIRQGKGGEFYDTSIFNKESNFDATLNFDKTFGDIRIDGLVGGNYRNDTYNSIGVGAYDLTVPDLYTISNAKGTPRTSMYKRKYETNSLYFAVNGSFKNYLFLGVTGRNDWSSTLPENNWSFFYPSVNLGFSVTDAFGIESNILSYAKVRASIAKVGGDTGPYQLARTYSAESYNSISAFSPTSTLPPVDLQPEETSSYEIGADMRFWKDRILLDVTYYDQTTVNQILSVATSRTTGYGAMRLNAGEIQNKGIELMASGALLQNSDGLSWNVSINWAKNKSVVNTLYGDLESYVISDGFGGATSLGIPGEEWGIIWGLPFVRDDKGKIVVDSRGIPKTTSVGQKLGSVTPDWTGGVTNSFRYKGFNLSALIDVRMGGDMFSCTAWHSYPTGAYAVTTANNVREEGLIVDGVFEDGTPNNLRVSAQDYFIGSWMWNNHEYSILDGSYVKLREVVFGYDFNVQKIKWIQKLNLSLVGRNLAILYQDESTKDLGLDPEVGLGGGEAGVGFENFQLPTTRNYGLKLKVNF